MMNKQNKKAGQKQNGQGFSRPKRQPQGGLLKVALSTATRAINSNVARQALGSVKVSSCAAKLACAIANPFSEDATGACFPVYPAPDSHKVQAFSRFDGAIGTAGVGIVAFTPSIANNMPSAYVSGATWTGTSASILTADSTVATGLTRMYHNGPYSAEQLVKINAVAEPLLTGRLVAVGIRITYTGTALNESGTCTLVHHNAHGNLSGANNANLQSFGNAEICPFTRKPCTLVLMPSAIHEASYPDSAGGATTTRHLYPFTQDEKFYVSFNGATTFQDFVGVDGFFARVGAPVGMILVTGVAGSTFHVDMVYHMEYQGVTASSSATPNSVDVSSVYAILTAAQQLSSRKMSAPSASNWALLLEGIRAAMGSPVMLTAKGIAAI